MIATNNSLIDYYEENTGRIGAHFTHPLLAEFHLVKYDIKNKTVVYGDGEWESAVGARIALDELGGTILLRISISTFTGVC